MGRYPLMTSVMRRKVREAHTFEELKYLCMDLVDAIDELRQYTEFDEQPVAGQPRDPRSDIPQ